MATAGRDTLLDTVKPHAPRIAERLVDNVLTALDEQTVVVAGTSAAATIVPRLAESLRAILDLRDAVAAQVDHLLEDHPLFPGPDLDSRHCGQDRRPDPRRDRRRQWLPQRRTPGLLRRTCAGNPPLRNQHPWGIPFQTRK